MVRLIHRSAKRILSNGPNNPYLAHFIRGERAPYSQRLANIIIRRSCYGIHEGAEISRSYARPTMRRSAFQQCSPKKSRIWANAFRLNYSRAAIAKRAPTIHHAPCEGYTVHATKEEAIAYAGGYLHAHNDYEHATYTGVYTTADASGLTIYDNTTGAECFALYLDEGELRMYGIP